MLLKIYPIVKFYKATSQNQLGSLLNKSIELCISQVYARGQKKLRQQTQLKSERKKSYNDKLAI